VDPPSPPQATSSMARQTEATRGQRGVADTIFSWGG
jgi:hypothetical protein